MNPARGARPSDGSSASSCWAAVARVQRQAAVATSGDGGSVMESLNQAEKNRCVNRTLQEADETRVRLQVD